MAQSLLDFRRDEITETLDADVCVIGAGAVGIALAREFINTSHRVLMLDCGGEDFDDDADALNRMEVVGLNPRNRPDEGSRLRQLGGTTNHWGGWNRPFSDDVLKSWPLRKGELNRYYDRTRTYLDLETGPFDELSAWLREPDQYLPDLNPWLDVVVRQIRALRAWPFYKKNLLSADNLRILTHASVQDLQFSESGGRVDSALAVTLPPRSRRVEIRAKAFIVCCGGLENPTLLLNIDRQSNGVLSAKTGALGRYYMDHAELSYDLLPFSCFMPVMKYRIENHGRGVEYLHVRPSWSLSAEAGTRWMPHALTADFHTQCTYRTKWEYENLHEMVKRPDANFDLPGKANPDAKIEFTGGLMNFGWTPVEDSRITLSEAQNSIGHQVGRLDWRISEEDVSHVQLLAQRLEQSLGASGFGRLRLGDNLLKRGLLTAEGRVYNGNHHMGATRMSLDPQNGVVDQNCRHHGVDNLYVAGASVFPTYDWPGPTFTAVALAIRLADHLKSVI